MSQIEKALEKFNKRPVPKDITFNEIVRIAKYHGCIVRPGGRHVEIYFPELSKAFPIPRHGKTIDPVYIIKLKDLFEQL